MLGLQSSKKGTEPDLQRWRAYPRRTKRWNKICFGCYNEESVDAYYVKIGEKKPYM